ncbi:MAG TPA: hypothetical protein PKE06_00180 [Flavilitoribacter sp.]|nr:hypothetical protein [Flavilitoribacter sp.]HMQ86540.1 hypothetical protein [Flavilitoribacter sp.]
MFTYNSQTRQQLDRAYDQLVAREIMNFKGNKIATGDQNILFASTQEVNGYLFLKLSVLGALHMGQKTECQVKFNGTSISITVDSDQREIETSYSTTLEKGITKFDILVEEDLMDFIRNEPQFSISILIPHVESKGFFSYTRRFIPCDEFIIHDLEAFRRMLGIIE